MPEVRVAVYCRISRDDAGDGAGVTRQDEDCRKLAAGRGWTVVRTFVDNDYSAFSGRRRPGYQQMLEVMRAGAVDVVLAWAPERLHRSPRELEDFIELIESTGTAIETVKAGAWDVSTSHGRLVARMLGAVSRSESERTGERVSRAHRQAQEQGRWRGPIPYGMRASNRPGLPEPDPDTAPMVREIIARVLRGDALTRIARDLNEAGKRPRRGTAWTHTGIDRLIGSPAIGGFILLDGELQPAAFEGLVTREEWRAARSALQRRPRGERRRPRETLTLLGGLLVCDEHGFPCYGGSRSDGPVYAAGAATCYVGISRPPVDALIRDLVVSRLQRRDAAQLLEIHRDTAPLEQEASDLRRRREEMTELIADGLLPATTARLKLQELARRLAEIESSYSAASIAPDAL
ncbi:MAG TPA: recombinase family protein, partial [Frankiaceae bacterium]|nr:recombinase family protein [Frankiaceae bacterium]